MKVLLVAGARPNFMKVAPLMWEFLRRPGVETHLVHTGQHYDERMSELFFRDLNLPRPDVNLEVGSGSHAVQTAEVMRRFEPVVTSWRPDVVVVVGDVNSTLACAITAVKLGVRVAHIEAGLRSFDRRMPEEINRVLTDAISDYLFVSEPSGVENLRREGVPKGRIAFVGNVMIDALLACRERARQSVVLDQLGVAPRAYAVLTLHRASNVDDTAQLRQLLAALATLGNRLPVVFPVHPRTRQAMRAAGHAESPGLILTEPLGYLDFMRLVSDARLVLTDSGGVQEETTVLGIPCLTLRENTERPATITHGTNRLVGLDPGAILAAAAEELTSELAGRPRRVPDLWDGRAAARIADVLWSSPAGMRLRPAADGVAPHQPPANLPR